MTAQRSLFGWLFGFEQEKEFVLLSFSEEEDFLLCLQSVTTPFLAFTLLNPFMVMPEYRPVAAGRIATAGRRSK